MCLDAQRRIGNRDTFTPHYYIYDDIKAYCRDDEANNYCEDIYTNGGMYCSNNDWAEGLTGADEVEEIE